MKIFLRYAFPLLVLLMMCIWFWSPSLLGGKTILHGDSMVHGLPMMNLHARSFEAGESLLWSNKIYGGHPVFAESQGAFFHPLNMLLAWLVAPVYGHNLFHFLCMLLSGAGTFGLCRALNIKPMASGFAAIAVSFSASWTSSQQNLSIAGAITWVPYVFWAFEHWLKRPNFTRAIAMAVAVVLVLLAGYPQALHGVIVYLAASLLPTLFSSRGRVLWAEKKHLMLTAIASGVVAVGLSAVQWLPLLELTSLSHRNAGVGLFLPLTDPAPYYRGLLFALNGLDVAPGQYVPSLGSLLVVAVASLILLVPTTDRIKGHILAAVFLLQLGMGPASPVFNFVYGAHLVPGLHFFRITSIYLAIAIIGLSVAAAWVVDRLSEGIYVERVRLFITVSLLLMLWASGCFWLFMPAIRWTQLAFAAIGILSILGCYALRKTKYLSICLLALLCFECANFRMHPFAFADAKLIKEPAVRASLIHMEGIADYKFLDASMAVVYAMQNPLMPELPSEFQRMLAAVSPMSNLMWGVASLNGTMGLQTQRRALAEPIIQNEINDQSPLLPGRRLIDVLGVRFISADTQFQAPDFQLREHDKGNRLWIMENTSALPRLQTYTQAVVVDSLEQAVHCFENPCSPGVVIENPEKVVLVAGNAPNQSDAIKVLSVEKAEATHYIVRVMAESVGWLFLADANYPGWNATIDGRATPIFSANVLGKAVQLEPGEHRVEMTFTPRSFYTGLFITMVFLLGLVAYAVSGLIGARSK